MIDADAIELSLCLDELSDCSYICVLDFGWVQEDTPTLAVLDAPAKVSIRCGCPVDLHLIPVCLQLHFIHRNASLTREQFLVAVQAGEVPVEVKPIQHCACSPE